MVDMKIKSVASKKEADKVVEFLCSSKAFDLEMTDWRKKARRNAVNKSLKDPNHRFWFIEDNFGVVCAAIGVCENERQNGGYYLDYFSVNRDFRRNKYGSRLLYEAEKFVRSHNGRFILADTGSTRFFKASRKFYEANGYKKVSFIPDYYDKGDSRIDYYKKL